VRKSSGGLKQTNGLWAFKRGEVAGKDPRKGRAACRKLRGNLLPPRGGRGRKLQKGKAQFWSRDRHGRSRESRKKKKCDKRGAGSSNTKKPVSKPQSREGGHPGYLLHHGDTARGKKKNRNRPEGERTQEKLGGQANGGN